MVQQLLYWILTLASLMPNWLLPSARRTEAVAAHHFPLLKVLKYSMWLIRISFPATGQPCSPSCLSNSVKIPSHTKVNLEKFVLNSRSPSQQIPPQQTDTALAEPAPLAEKPAPYTNVIMPSLFSIICFLGIVGNLIVIYTIVKKKKLRCKQTVPDIFIFNLSIVDLLFLLGMPFLIHQLLGNGSWYFGAPLCTIITALDTNSQITSTNILTAMTLDRYLAIVYPLKSTYVRTPCVAALVICLVWLLSFLTIIPVWMYAGLMPLEDGTVRCALLLPNPETDIYWFTLYQFMLAFAVPLIVICVVYFKILQHMATTVVPLPQRSLQVRTKKVTRMAVAICSAFFLCWAPYYILQLVHLGIDTPSMAFFYAYNFAISLGYANSCLNPFLYIALSETFKRQFLVAIRPAKEPGHNSSVNNNSMTEASVCLKLAPESTQQTQFLEDFSPHALPVTVAVH